MLQQIPPDFPGNDHQNLQSIPYQYFDAVGTFKENNPNKWKLYLYKFKRLSANKFFKYTSEFDESGFSEYLINFVNPIGDLEILYNVFDILLNLTSYENEPIFLFSVLKKDLLNKLNDFFRNPINDVVSCKIFKILANIISYSIELRDEIISVIDLSFFINPSFDSFYYLEDAFALFSQLLSFETNEQMLIYVLDFIFPHLYVKSRKNNSMKSYNSFISFLYDTKNNFSKELFDKYLINGNIMSDLIYYFSNFSMTIPQKYKYMLLSIFSFFLPMDPSFFLSLTPIVVDYVNKIQHMDNSLLDNVEIQGYSIIMNQLFLRFIKLYKIDVLENIIASFLKLGKNIPFKIKRQICLIVSAAIPLLPPSFSHSSLDLLINMYNDLIETDLIEILLSTILLVINIQLNENVFEDGKDIIHPFVDDNYDVLIKNYEQKDQDENLKKFISTLFSLCENED